MALMSALTAAQLSDLREEHYSGDVYLSLCDNEQIYTARVNEPAGLADSFAQFEYDGGAGVLADVEVGMTILVSTTNDPRAAHWRGRIRQAPGATTIYINETSGPDWADNDYVFILYDFAIREKLARQSGGAQQKDYIMGFFEGGPVISGLQSAYADFVDDVTGVYQVAFAAVAYSPTDGGAIASYQYAFPAGYGAVAAGALNTANVTINFNPGFWWGSLAVADNVGTGRTTVFHFCIWAHDASYPPETGFGNVSVTGSVDGGWSASITAWDGVDDVLDGTLCCIWSDEYHGDPAAATRGPVVNNVNFHGRLRKERDVTETDMTYSVLTESRLEIEGPMAQLARITAPLITMINDDTPVVWDEIDELTVWRAICHMLAEHTTFLELHSLSFDSTADTFECLALDAPQGNMLSSIADLADSITARFEMNPQGEAQVNRDGRYLSAAARNALTTVADFEQQDWVDFIIEHDHEMTIGHVEASGGTFANATGDVTTVLSVAPGEAWGSGGGGSGLHGQILERDQNEANAQAELNIRSGHHFAAVNPADRLVVVHPDMYHCLYPCRAQWFTWAIAATEDERGIEYDDTMRWWLESISWTHDNARGGRDVEAVYVRETQGGPGVSVIYPEPGEINVPYADVPPFSPYGAFPETTFYLVPAPGDEDYPPHNNMNPNNPNYDNEDRALDTWTHSYFSGNGESDLAWRQMDVHSKGTCTPWWDSVNDREEGCTGWPVTNVAATGEVALAPDTVVTSISATVYWNKTRVWGAGAPDVIIRFCITPCETGTILAQYTIPGGVGGAGNHTLNWNGTAAGASLIVEGGCRNNNDGDGSYWRVTALTIAGTGTDPLA